MTTGTQAAIEMLRGLIDPDYSDGDGAVARVGDLRAALALLDEQAAEIARLRVELFSYKAVASETTKLCAYMAANQGKTP
jgi:hypothetical protein